MGSLWSWWTLWAGATLLWGLTQEASVNPRNANDREEFLTAFLQNYRSGYSQASLHLFLTSMSAKPASVFIFSHADGTSQEITVRPGQSVMANISSKAEMIGSKIFHHAVVVRSDRAISVQAVNSKPNSAELTLLQPVRALGTEYFVFTPPGSSTQNVKEFAVVAGPANTTIHVNLKGAVTFQGKFYPAGSVLSVTLEPFQVAQLQSTADLSGSKITASIPVAVLSGHTCAQKHTTCNHVVEQLLPTSAWGTHYVVATLASQTRYDLAFVVASQNTRVTYNHGGTTGSHGLQEGSVLQFEIRPSRPLYLTADVGVQVLLFGTGATRGGVTHDPYLVLIPDVASYCSAYMVKSMPGSNGVALVVTPTEAANTLMVDESALGTNVTWTPVPGSEFSFAEVDLGTADTIHVAKAGTSFGLLTFGLGQAVGFGTAAACSQTTPAPEEASCEGVSCPPWHHCKVVGGKPTCVEVSVATCRAQGDPHYTTFDGLHYDMMGTCTYTITELCSKDLSLPAFSVEAKNEHRNSRRVSYVGFVTVRAYGHSVSLARGEVGFARIDNQRSSLPVSMEEGRLRVYQSGRRAIVELDFGLIVTYDWDCQLAVSLPEKFKDNVCGLCGNYNGNPKDDFLTRDGVLAPNAMEFASKWKLDDGDYLCTDGCADNCPSCTPGQAQHYEGDRLCGMLTLPSGPFAVCHHALEPKPFLQECVYDMCVGSGDRSNLCRALSAYAQACLELGISVGNWRLPANCPLSCPANSRYEHCSPACPISCNPTGAPSNCSERPCVEGCVCLPGFVASGDACVAPSSCGCLFENHLLAPGEAVWADQKCRRRCVCDAKTHKMVCSDTPGCPSGERCRIQNGLLGCYPNSLGICQASGDPHYLTFDGRRFDFMGTCTYLLTGTCGPTGTLPAFRVLVQNEHRGSQTVSYTRAVRVEAHGVKVEVRREYPGRVLVDGVLQYLPFQTADGQVQVYRQGQDAVVRTDFGLIVTYDWNTRVTAKVPSSYAGMLCGLCGNFNGRTEDDLELRGGGQAANALAFGNSWQEETSPGCGANPPGDCPQLDSMVEEQLQSKKECGIIADPDGPFQDCHYYLEPEDFLRDCVYDRCLLPGQPGSLCDALADYTAACQAAGATVEPWRTEEFCPMSCPLNSSYELCSHGCPLSCGDQPVPGGCGSDCHEDCMCDEGFVLSGESCVPLASCGCVHQGAYHPLGESFYEPGCKSLCHCHEGGVVTCQPSTCGPHEACQPSNGVLGCVPVGSVTCQASGDPHYTTFDGRRFDFMGLCVYVLAQTCGNRTGLHRFTVLQENERYSSRASVTKAITVLVDNYSLRLEQRKWKVTVNGVDMKLPVELAEGRIRAFKHGKDAVIQTDFGLRVAYDLVYNVRVTVPGNYYEQMCGLCGDYNGDSKDDFQKPDGSQAGNPNDFGNSWEEKVPGSPCLSPPPCEDCGPVCTPEQEQQYQQEKFCGFLTKPTGPLAACHKLLSPQGALKDCIFDLCVSGGNLSILCSSIEAYVSACQAAGGHVEPWRTESFCPMKCPPNSHYEVCADTCSLSCSALGTPQNCPEGCAEGCQCDPGFLNSGEACVPMEECGCYHNGVYYEPDESVLLDNCQQHCVCHAGKGMVCKEHSCKPEEECRAQNGLLGCYPNSLGSCQASGDPHYLTFDGRRFDFMGTCTYLLTGTCGPTGMLPAFRVLVQNEHRGSQTVSYTRAVRVEARGVKVEVRREYPGRVLVDGVLQYLPFQAADGQVQVYRQGQDAVVRTDFGLIVTYDWNTRVTAKVPSSYAGMLCGLCGNFNGRTEDDLELRGGGQAANALAFGNSWQEETSPGCGANPPGDCPQLDSMVEEQLQSKKECGIIADPDGPFKKCHSKLEPEGFLRDCVYDRCLLPGQPGSLCDALADYTAACQAAGATVEPWRTEEFCPMSCPLNSSYELCSHGCPPSCGDQPVPGGCGSNCHEDCVCDEGFVLSGESCVPLASCGCVHQGAYHPLGESFYEPGCKSLCHCHEGGVVTCQPSTCGPHEACQPSNGVLGCVPVGSVTCQASGDPHYTTFDGRRFDFMGLCVYVLAQTCGNRTGLHRFTVLQENERYSSRASVTKAITVLVDNYSLRLEQRKWKVTVNGVDMKLPVELAEGRIRAFKHGKDAVIQTDFGLRVAYDLVYNVRVTVPGNYYEQMCGLCGDYNGDSKDDFQKPDGSQAGNPNDFGNSWEEKVPGSPCLSPPPCEDCGPVCTPEQEQQYQQEKFCGFLTKPTGPLAACHKLLSPQGALKDCIFDLCVSGGNLSILCSSIEAYVSACQAAGGHVEPWRTESFCPMKCPPNSHYEVCADTCSLSCSALGTPQNCPEGCAEGCQCDPGFLNSGEACVPMEECGCYHNGVYYEPDESVLLDNCQQHCVCHAGKGMVCKEHSCKPEEECRAQNGLLGCYPNSLGSCQASGDPHYLTFDGRRFDFMGTCTYLLTGTCGPTGMLPAFRVLVQNEHRGSQTVSYTRAVRVEARGVKVEVRREYPGRVLVDGVLQYLPFQAADGQVQVYRQGQDAVVRTDFGLIVTYDWNTRVTAKVPSSYAGMLCGLCGNFNGRTEDDLELRGGGQAANALAFGNSWQEETSPGCGANPPGDCPQLDSMVEEQLQSKKECGIIADPDGPFKKCHSKLEPEGFLRDCVYDRCLLPGQPGSLCDALADYTAACQAAGATVEPWRTEEFCPMSCPLNSSYELCSHGCPPSCGDLLVPGGCGSKCHEDCVCDEGFVLSGESCVPLASCGCVHQGAYHPLGESFYEPGCKSLCHCHEGGVVTCQPSTCGPHEACQPSNGVLDCVPVGSVTCQASGDPHYTTFDGRRFDFMGLCVYVLAQTCGNRTGLHRFTVLQENERYSSRASVTKAITVLVDNYSLRLEQRKWKVTVNGVDMKLPVELAEGRIRAFKHGKDAVIQTDFGLRVAYDLVYNVRVTVPGNYYEQMCGLCGDYNGDSKDDFQKPDGSQAGNPNDFGNSWEEKVPGSPCLSPPPCEDCGPVCTPEQEQQYQQEKFCGFLTKPTGPLAACHKLLSPQGALKDCIFDLCVSGGNLSILCSSIEAYVSACQAAGGHVEPWRTESFCPMKCPPNSHYEVCADTCSLSCSALGTPQNCPERCAEGCQCDPGFLNSGEACVPMEECGCYHNGVYYEPDESVLLDNCHQQCVCRSGKGMVCKEHSCKPEEECQPSGGILSCIKKDPCQDVICRPQETCKEKDGEGVCVPNYEDTCWLWGDPHYHSFDGRDFDFQGTCDYVLATTACPGVSAQDLIPFTVTTKNENRGNPAVSYVRRVTVTTLGVNISIHKDEIGKVRVNGVQTALPVSAAGGRISVTHGSSKAVLVTDFGLRVSYDWNWRVEVTLPSSYHGAVCGLCGNMDRNASNDHAFPNGTLAPSIPAWGGSWRVPGWDPLCWDECQGSCPTCSGDQLEEYGGPAYCGPLASGAGGPFAACHAHVPPDSFFEGCVLDVCMGGGAHDILCKALAAYAATCQAAGIVIEDWRLQAGCELPCPSNSHYELCGPVCPASCPSPAPPTTPAFCEGPCAEGCQCDPGFVLSIDHCVPLDGGCGCWANGTYHEAGSEFWSDGTCSQLCRCGPGGGSVDCTPASCGLGEECTLLPSGQFGCHPISTAECQAWGDPHYVTLDGHRFDFQGTCEYLLSGVCGELPNGVEHFTVTVANEHRGSQAVSYTRSVTLSIYNHNLTLSAQWPRKLQVDGELVSLPFQLDSRLHAYVSGANVVVTAANGLSLAFDGNNFVRLRVPAVYAGALCGLCGNYNQDSSDDPEAVGKDPGRWQVGGAPGCGECVPGPCPSQCTPEEQEQFGGPDACGIISAPDGPLAPCHTLVPPEQYFQACLLDACQVQGHPGGLCPAVAAYVAACQAAGAQIEEWRRPDFCPLQCPANSHYELCGDSCPVSCPSLSVPEGCESVCQEGCVCDAGFVLSGDTCVPVGQCGCLHEGRYYPQGEIFYPGPECGRRCECGPGGQVNCQEGTDCGPYEECRVQDGVQACHATGCGRCLANGGIHYVTLDGRVYDLHGTCSYVLAQVCHPQPGDEDFSIVLEKDTAGKPQRLLVTVADQVVSLAPGPLVTVDGEVVTLPVSMGHVRVTAEGRNVILQTTKGLRLLFDGDAHVLMSIPSPFHGRMCGLCGNFNGNWTDDFVLPDGSVAPSVEAFGAAWRTPSSSQGCIEGCGPQGCPVCLAEQTAPFESLQACGKLRDPNGPFSACHEVLSPSEYFRQCVYDMCAHEGDHAFLCSSLAAYTAACQAAGAEVKPWRTDSFCPLRCPANSHYSVCMHSCQDSCAGLSGLTGCTTRCFEGCDCDEGFLLSQGICIPTRDCGCTHDGRYLPMNTSLLTPDCGELCSCSSSSVLMCQPAGCQSGLICAIQDGSQGCWAPQGLCSLSAGGNLTTFDGAQNVISSPNVYELSVRCPGFQGAIPWYRVLVDIPICSGKVGAARQVHVFFQDGLVTVNPNKGVWVNGLRVDLPAKMLASVSVSRNPDGSVLVKQKAGVQVQLWPNGQLTVMVSSDHARMLCGACGNFDGVEVNDGHTSQGKTSMERWRAKDFSPCSA
ncbi:IgGFc-binding protein [Talpa occidentalis]|uniref:IgGFc-binding protein n=1 Tax=Talpa occidentalis TaxID=50954 RepID=UPI00188FFE64|nr:IgGFc-binding protein [Talpa occidentalis]